MRKLTVIRRKAFAGCLVHVKVYMVDAMADPNSDKGLLIDGLRCGRLGVIKNGESLTVEIPDCDVTVYAVVSDTFSDTDNESIFIPAGTQDVIVTGKCSMWGFMAARFKFDRVPVLPKQK